MTDATRPSIPRLLGVLALIVLVQLVGMIVASRTVGGILFAPLIGIPTALVILAVLVALTAAVVRLATGRWGVLAGFVATGVSVATFIAFVARAGQLPVMWIPELNVDVASPLAGLVGGLTAGLFLPRAWFRVAGAVVVLGATAFFAVPLIVNEVTAQQARDEAERAAQEQGLEDYLNAVTRPVTIDDDRAEVVIFGVGEYISTLRVVVDGEATFDVQTVPDSGDTGRPELPCWLMVRDTGMLDETVTMEQYEGICTYDGAGRWQTTDGSAVAVEFEDLLVIVRTPLPEFPLEEDSWRAATPSEIEGVLPLLHRMTPDEFRAFHLQWWEEHG